LLPGEELPELRIHYRTIGKPLRDYRGRVTNAVLILHGTTGSGNQFIRAEFAGELFGAGKWLDAGTVLSCPTGWNRTRPVKQT
jgi:homoserine O-acetyltransferase